MVGMEEEGLEEEEEEEEEDLGGALEVGVGEVLEVGVEGVLEVVGGALEEEVFVEEEAVLEMVIDVSLWNRFHHSVFIVCNAFIRFVIFHNSTVIFQCHAWVFF